LAAKPVNGSEIGARSGAQTLSLLAAPLNLLVLRALADGPKQQAELRREAGSPAQTTLRAQLKKLTAIGAITKRRRNPFPGLLEYELVTPGRDLLFVASILESWLDRAPEGPQRLESNAARAAVKALAEGWSTTMLRALAARPLSLTELDRVIGSLSYPSLERRLAAMRLTGQIEARSSNGRGTPYAVTGWLRRGVAPLAAAARWERCHLPRMTAPIGGLDTEAVFLLAVPLLRLPAELSGTCRMAMEIPNGDGRRHAGVTVEVRDGRIVSCTTQLQVKVDAWALGSAIAWLDALVGLESDRLEFGGEGTLVGAVLEALHETLFGVPMRKLP
jgi:DNA-binding HxlR family transcriptional regulator